MKKTIILNVFFHITPTGNRFDYINKSMLLIQDLNTRCKIDMFFSFNIMKKKANMNTHLFLQSPDKLRQCIEWATTTPSPVIKQPGITIATLKQEAMVAVQL